MSADQLSLLLSLAERHHREGRLREARSGYEEVLRRSPDHVAALFLAGIAAQQSGDAASALERLSAAARQAPDDVRIALALASVHQTRGELAQAAACIERVVHLRKDPALWNNLGVMRKQLGETAAAQAAFREAAALQPGHPSACNNLGNLAREQGDIAQAETWFRQALAARPDYPEALNNLGLVLFQQASYEEAETVLRRALELRPDYGHALRNLGAVVFARHRPDEAESLFRRAIDVAPGDAESRRALGNLLLASGRPDDAAGAFRLAAECAPLDAEALHELGTRYLAERLPADAVRVLERALTLEAQAPHIHFRLGLALVDLNRRADAGKCFRRALELRPEYAEAHVGLGVLYEGQREFEQAERHYRKAYELQPALSDALVGLARSHRHLCLWDELGDPPAASLDGLLDHWEAMGMGPLVLLATPAASRADHRRAAEACARRYVGGAGDGGPARLAADSHERLRIGYLSNDLHDHPVSQLLVEIIEQHDREGFETFAYCYFAGAGEPSPLRTRMAAAFDRFREVGGLTDAQIAARIAEDGIDILVDLKGYTAGARPGVLALRAAPVQVNWLGYPGTLGSARLADYLVGDATVTPVDEAADYSEHLALMPHCYLPSDRQRAIGEMPLRSQAGLPEQGFVFCSFNQSFKFTASVFDVWCRLLRSVPDSVLWLSNYHAAARRNLAAEAQRRGVAAERLVFAPRVATGAEHLGRLRLADLALDTGPYGSHSTGIDALWSGVPLVTCPGESFASRVGASLLKAAGLPELVASNLDDYYRIAVELASDAQRLGELRGRLRAQRLECPLFDSMRFARDLEALYRRMWQNHVAGVHRPITLTY